MAAALKDDRENSPLSVNIEMVLPGVNGRIAANTSSVNVLHSKVDTGFAVVLNKMQEWGIHICDEQRQYLAQQSLEQCNLVGASLVTAGNQLLQRGGGGSIGSALDLEDEEEAERSPPPLESVAALPPMDNADGRPLAIALDLNRPCDEQQLMVQATTEKPVFQHTFKLKMTYPSLLSVWEEWFGVGDSAFDPGGGVAGRDAKFGRGWRGKHNSYIDKSQVSRTARLVEAVVEEARKEKSQPEDVLLEWEPIFAQCNNKVSKMVTFFQKQGRIKAKGKRGIQVAKERRAAATTVPTTTTVATTTTTNLAQI